MGIPNMVITDLGKALLAKSPTGTALPVTRWQIGKGALEEGQPLQGRTQLLEPVKYILLAEVKNQGNQCTVTGQFLNTGMEEFRWEELGLLATDPDLGEILYAYGNARGNGDLIEAGEEKYREAIFGIELVFDGVANVTAVIDQSLVFIPMSQKGQPGGVATLDDTGKVPEEQLPVSGSVPSVVDFTAAEWSGGKLTIPQERHGRSSGSFWYTLRHKVSGQLKGNTWAVHCTDVNYDSQAKTMVLTCGDAYDGQISFYSA